METPGLHSTVTTPLVRMDLPAALGTGFSEVILGDVHRTTARMTVGREEQVTHHKIPDHFILEIHDVRHLGRSLSE